MAMLYHTIFLLNNYPEAGCQVFSPGIIFFLGFFQGPAHNANANRSINVSEQFNCVRPFFGSRACLLFISYILRGYLGQSYSVTYTKTYVPINIALGFDWVVIQYE